MRIIYDYQIFSWQRYGGISRYIIELSQHIASFPGNEVEIFAPFIVNHYLLRNEKVRNHWLNVPDYKPIHSVIKNANRFLARLIIKPRKDVDIFHETYYSKSDRCPRSAKRIITIHDMIHEKFPHMFSTKDNTRQNKELAVKRADHVICVSKNTQEDLIRILRVPKNKTSVIYHGYAFQNFHEPCENKATYRPFILFVGHRDGYKNFSALLNAYANSQILKNNFSIVCFGGGKFNSNEILISSKLKIAAEKLIQISGDDHLLARLYRTASVFVYASLYEGFGIPPLEAMSFGCPVVCSNKSSMPEVVGDAAEFYDPTGKIDLKTAIETVVNSKERANCLIERGYERIKNFSWEKCALKTIETYKNVLST